MPSLARLAALVLAGVLVVAAGAKVRRPDAVADDFAALGLVAPRRLAVAVPVAEIVCAALLVVAPAWGGIVGFALLAGFTAVLVRTLRSGLVVACRCFGAIDDRPVSWRTIARNAALLALAAIAATST